MSTYSNLTPEARAELIQHLLRGRAIPELRAIDDGRLELLFVDPTTTHLVFGVHILPENFKAPSTHAKAVLATLRLLDPKEANLFSDDRVVPQNWTKRTIRPSFWPGKRGLHDYAQLLRMHAQQTYDLGRARYDQSNGLLCTFDDGSALASTSHIIGGYNGPADCGVDLIAAPSVADLKEQTLRHFNETKSYARAEDSFLRALDGRAARLGVFRTLALHLGFTSPIVLSSEGQQKCSR